MSMGLRAGSGIGICIGGLLLGACGSGGGFPDARVIDAPPPGGTFTLDWSVTDLGNQNVSCDKIGATSVTALAHNRAFEGGTTQVFTCSTGMGTSQAMTPGTYDIDFELDAVTGVLATSPVQHGVEIASDANVRLTPLEFSLDATGGVVLALNSGAGGGNCGLVGNGGAGITATTLTLVHNGDSTCEPQTVDISASTITGAMASTYTIDCATPVDGPCIETDQTISATGVPADSYTIHIRGKIGTANCWSNNDSLQVPPLGATLQRTLNLSYASGTPGC
jgi:hypothetical protein